jgi:hypothetical protein
MAAWSPRTGLDADKVVSFHGILELIEQVFLVVAPGDLDAALNQRS